MLHHLILIVILAASAAAKPTVQVKSKPATAPFVVGQAWGDDAKSELIGGEQTALTKVSSLIYDTGLQYMMNSMAPFQDLAENVAKQCKNKYSADVMRAVSCVAQGVNQQLAKRKSETGKYAPSAPIDFTFCRAHATAFRAAILKLGIARTSVGFEAADTSEDNHVVSRINMTSTSGERYSWVIDVGNQPGKLFPYTDQTAEYHHKNPDQFPNFAFEGGVAPAASAIGAGQSMR